MPESFTGFARTDPYTNCHVKFSIMTLHVLEHSAKLSHAELHCRVGCVCKLLLVFPCN